MDKEFIYKKKKIVSESNNNVPIFVRGFILSVLSIFSKAYSANRKYKNEDNFQQRKM